MLDKIKKIKYSRLKLDKIKKIKYSRLSKEERFFLDMIDGIEPFKSDKYPQSVFWKKNDVILLEQDFRNEWLHVNYKLIWSIFETKYGYNYVDTQSFIKDVMERNTNLGLLTPKDLHIDRNSGSLIPKIQESYLYGDVERGDVERYKKLGTLSELIPSDHIPHNKKNIDLELTYK